MALSFRRLRPVLLLVAIALVGAAVWRSVSVGMWPPEDMAARDDWETASPKDCPLMAQALAASGATQDVAAPPLMGKNRGPGPCDWPRFGLRLARVTDAEFRAATAGVNHSTGYIPHLSLSRPRYSLFHLRAEVSVGSQYGWEEGGGDICSFSRGLRGWRLERCRRGWIS